MHMRVALVSPYSWTHPGGVTRHIEALSAELLAAGHHVRVLAPYDGDPADAPEGLISLGRTIGLPFNGAVSNLALTPFSAATLRRELRAGAFDVVHVHEPVAPVPGWLALAVADSPLVGTFHTYTERVAAHAVAALWGSRRNLNRLHVRIAVSEAAVQAASTGSCPTASCCRPGAHRNRVTGSRASRSRSRSSARRSPARACRSCCAPSRLCASTCPRV